jgi:hypothetical protein
MQQCLLFTFLLFALTSCDQNNGCIVDQAMLERNDSLIAVLEEDPLLGLFLSRFEEVRLKDLDQEIFRLIINNQKYQSTEIYKLEKTFEKYTLSVKKYAEAKVKPYNDSLVKFESKNISEKEWLEFQVLVDQGTFWGWPVKIGGKASILEGVNWMLEGYSSAGARCTQRNYHLVGRISPGPSAFRNLCDSLVVLGG